jgi:inorganic pyrophosphatase
MTTNPTHPWHFVKVGKKVPSIVTAIIEIPRGSNNKYEIDKQSGLLLLDRVLSSPVYYPINYGFIPQTYCEDGDALDVMVISQSPVQPLAMMNVKVVGAMKMIDGGDSDDKIIAVHADDKQYDHINDLSEVKLVNPQILQEIEQFFKIYKLLDNKKVEVNGWVGREDAEKIVLDSIELYNKNKEKLMASN